MHPVFLVQVPQQLPHSSNSKQQQQQQQPAAVAASRSSQQQRQQQQKRRQPRRWLHVELRRPMAMFGSKDWLSAKVLAATGISFKFDTTFVLSFCL